MLLTHCIICLYVSNITTYFKSSSLVRSIPSFILCYLLNFRPTPHQQPRLNFHVGLQPTAYSLRLPRGWEQNTAANDRAWVGCSVFTAKGKLTTSLKIWWYPPPLDHHPGQSSPDTYQTRCLLLWMPRRMWSVKLYCPCCGPQELLRSRGLYNRVRLVLDTKDRYYLAGEYMDCRACGGTYISWEHRMLQQLSAGIRARFWAASSTSLHRHGLLFAPGTFEVPAALCQMGQETTDN